MPTICMCIYAYLYILYKDTCLYTSLILTVYCIHCTHLQVFNELPLEFAAEVNELMSLKLEGTVG